MVVVWGYLWHNVQRRHRGRAPQRFLVGLGKSISSGCHDVWVNYMSCGSECVCFDCARPSSLSLCVCVSVCTLTRDSPPMCVGRNGKKPWTTTTATPCVVLTWLPSTLPRTRPLRPWPRRRRRHRQRRPHRRRVPLSTPWTTTLYVNGFFTSNLQLIPANKNMTVDT